VQVQLHFVMVLSVICKSATTNHATIGLIKNGLTGQLGRHAQNHVVVALESAEEHVKLLITSAVMIGLWFFINLSFAVLLKKKTNKKPLTVSKIIKSATVMKMLVQPIVVHKK